MGEMALVQQTRICDLKCLQDRQAFVTLLTPSMKQRQEVLPTPSRQLSSYQEQSSHCNSTQQDEQTSQVGAMASSNPTDLAKLLESVSVTDNSSSAAEEALSNLFGVEIPLDAAVDGAAGFLAKQLGFQSENLMFPDRRK